jgi:sigma-E factor negative regulatory protein RseA
MESVSTLMDGEHNMDEAGRQIVRLKTDAAMRETWDTYHLIGDVMRGGAAVARVKPGFAARVSERLAQEPTVLAPQASRLVPRLARNLHDHALGLAASVAAVAVVGWVAMSTMAPDSPISPSNGLAPTLATSPAKPAPVTPVVAEARPAAPAPKTDVAEAAVPAERMQEYLLAHQGVSPSTAIQGVTPYIRTVSGSDE